MNAIPSRGPAWGGLVVNAILVAVLLVLATALAVVGVVVPALSHETGGAADSRLVEALIAALPIALVTMAIGAILGGLLAWRAREPVALLAAAAGRLRDGDLSTPIPRTKNVDLAPLADELELVRSSVATNLQAVAGEEARLRAVFAALAEPIITTASDGRVTGFNPAATNLLGAPVSLYGRPIGELLPFVSPPAPTTSDKTAGHGTITDVTGRTLDVEVTRTTLAEGRLPSIDVYVVHDISHHAQLNRMREQLLYNVAHELRAPMAVLANALEMLATEYGDLSAQEFDQLLASARRTVTRLHHLMEDLLNAGTIQSGRFVIRAQPTELSAIVQDAMEIVQFSLDARNQHVEVQMPNGGCLLLVDRRYVRQVLSNLLANASKYSPEGDTIAVRAEPSDGSVHVTVEDHGPGIAAEQQAGLFERFYRVRPGNEEPGVGLGLAIAKGIIDAHGGSIGVESEIGVGTKVWFRLPQATEPGASTDAAEERAEKPRTSAAQHPGVIREPGS
jgi:two-component system sensor histidine kinase VicK